MFFLAAIDHHTEPRHNLHSLKEYVKNANMLQAAERINVFLIIADTNKFKIAGQQPSIANSKILVVFC